MVFIRLQSWYAINNQEVWRIQGENRDLGKSTTKKRGIKIILIFSLSCKCCDSGTLRSTVLGTRYLTQPCKTFPAQLYRERAMH